MLIMRRRTWDLPEARSTPESIYLSRRTLLAGLVAGAGGAMGRKAQAASALPGVASASNARYVAGRALTAEKSATTYNNYYEVSTDKDLWQAAQAIKQRPWTIEVGGMVATPRTFGIDDLLALMPLEQRVYRHRCVETWAMTVPWSGFQLSKLLDLVQPSAGARYVTFTSLADEKTMPGIDDPTYPWPYLEAITIAEAHNELAFIGTGLYGKPMPPQDGGPIRLVLPWKYGFKSAKALVKITLTDKRPVNFWQALNPSEYGFWANVNPDVPHPRWSQATERLLGSDEIVPTQLYNGYGSIVAGLYGDLKGEKLFM